jgi:hypothetical protein
VLWLVVGLAPALVVPVEYNTLHAIAAMPPVFLLIGLGFRTLTKVQLAVVRIGLIGLLGVGFGVTAVRTARAYFATWSDQRDVQVAYHSHVVTLGRHLDRQISQSPVVITSLYPGEFHDPYTMEVTLKRQDLDLHWSDARYALMVPDQPSRLFVEEQTEPNAVFDILLADKIHQIVTLNFGKDAIPSQIRGYDWDSEQAWITLRSTLDTDARAQSGDPPPDSTDALVQAPVSFGDIVSLVGYKTQVITNTTPSLELMTAWKVERPTEEQLRIFSHLLTPTGELIDQVDRLDAPSWQWREGDQFVQLHRLQLPAHNIGTPYSIALGFYAPSTLSRLPVRVNTAMSSNDPLPTRILIPVPETARLDTR